MQHLHSIAEDEMVAVFLQTEIASSRFRPIILELLRRDGRDPRLIEHPDLASADENAYRRHLLGEHLGYRRNGDVFTDFPAGVRWYRALITKEELAQVRYLDLDDDDWRELSGGRGAPSTQPHASGTASQPMGSAMVVSGTWPMHWQQGPRSPR